MKHHSLYHLIMHKVIQIQVLYLKSFLDNSLVMSLQWLNMDMGLINSNEQRITTSRENSFFTTTNYVYEVDVFLLNLSYNFNKTKSKTNFIKSEFGEREF